MTNIADIAITSLDVMRAYSLTGVPMFVLDEMEEVTIANTQERGEVKGKLGRLLTSLKRNKSVSISGTNGLLSAGMLETQTGNAFEKKDSTPVVWTDYLVVASNKATTEYKAVGTVGAEIEALYVLDENGVAIKKLEQTSESPTTGKFKYTAGTMQLEFFADEVPDGTQIAVYYTRNIAGHVLSNMSDHFSQKVRLYIDATGEDRCGNTYHIQIYIPKADFDGDFDLKFGGDQTAHAFKAVSLAGACGSSGSMLWNYTVFGSDAPDVGV